MATITKELKAELIEKLNSPFASLKLDCDGYQIGLQAQSKDKSGLRFVLSLYVNGWMKGVWLDLKNPCPEQKFMRRMERPLHSKKEQEAIVKFEVACGMKRKDAIDKAARKFAYLAPYFPSGRAAIHHLCRVCESITIVADEVSNSVAVPERTEP
jgi:hypothetical protein